jgi:hypothetical protein
MRIEKNFYYYVDNDGNMPFISRSKRNVISHPNFVQYKDNKPVAYHGIIYKKVWDYSLKEYVSIELLKSV